MHSGTPQLNGRSGRSAPRNSISQDRMGLSRGTSVSSQNRLAPGGRSQQDLHPVTKIEDDEWEDVTESEQSLRVERGLGSPLTKPLRDSIRLTTKITRNSNGSVIVGSTFNYIVKVMNLTPHEVIHPQLTVTIPVFEDLISVNTAQAPNWNTSSSTSDGTVVISTITSLAPKASAVFNFRLKQNIVESSISDYSLRADFIADDVTAVSIVDPINIVYRANLHLEKASRVEGHRIFYTLKVTNHGPSIANNVSITDVLPDGVEFVSVSAPNAIVNVVKGIVIAVWPGDTLAKQSHTMNLEVTIPESLPEDRSSSVNDGEKKQRRFFNRAVATSLTSS